MTGDTRIFPLCTCWTVFRDINKPVTYVCLHSVFDLDALSKQAKQEQRDLILSGNPFKLCRNFTSYAWAGENLNGAILLQS